MAKNAIVNTLTVVCLPLGAIASAVATALLMAGLALVSPILIFGCALRASGGITNKLLDWLSPSSDENSLTSNFIKHLLLKTLFTILLLAPLAAGLAIIGAILMPSVFLALTFVIPYKGIEKVFSYFEQQEDEESASETDSIYAHPNSQVHEGVARDNYHSPGLRFFSNPGLLLTNGPELLEEARGLLGFGQR